MRRYFEFALVVLLVAVLAVIVMRALGRAQRDMEEAGVQAEVASIRTQLLETVAHRETFGGRLPISDNPLDWVGSKPLNYVGESSEVPPQKGVWYFDKNNKMLVYLFRDGHAACFRLSRNASNSGNRGVVAGVGLLRLDNKTE